MCLAFHFKDAHGPQLNSAGSLEIWIRTIYSATSLSLLSFLLIKKIDIVARTMFNKLLKMYLHGEKDN